MKKVKKSLLLLLPVLILIIGIVYIIYIPKKQTDNYSNLIPPQKTEESEESEGEPGFQKEYFGATHYPEDAILSQEQLIKMWEETRKVPGEKDLYKSNVVPWRILGPYGSAMDSSGVRKFSGRVLDMRLSNNNLKVAAASGGLWISNGNEPICLTDNLPSLAIGSFDICPTDSNIIIIGTGEPYVSNGTGLYRTTNRGQNWIRTAALSNQFFKIRYTPGSSNIIHAATVDGYFRSNDNGLTWTKYLDGQISDVDINPQSTNIVYCGLWDDGNGRGGIYKSTNSGTNWSRLNVADLPNVDVGRTSISICKGSPNIVWVLVARNSDNTLMGVYRTAADQVFWTKTSLSEDIFEEIGWYVNTLSVCPTNPALAFAGGVWLYRTSNNGINWFKDTDITTSYNLHCDLHEIIWDASGQNMWVAHDGGVSFSNDRGLSYTTADNNYPITQYVNFDVGPNNPDVIWGGSRDNGFTGTTNGGIFWKYGVNWGGDGGGVAIDPFNSSLIYGTIGVFGGSLSFHRLMSFNNGNSWDDRSTGIGASAQGYPKIRAIGTTPTTLYTNSQAGLYYTTNYGTSWSLQDAVFPAQIYDFYPVYYAQEQRTNIFVILASADAGKRLFVKSNTGNFTEISTGLPEGLRVKGVTPHPTIRNTVYALMTGLTDGKKIYKTTNLGTTWTNISGNIPNVPMSALVTHPKNVNILYLGTEMGCYKTTNRGVSWFRWNEGMPEAAIVTEMKSYTTQMNEFHIAAATYGRSIFSREEVPQSTPSDMQFELLQNYPNPFNPITQITFIIPEETKVTMRVYDVTGKLITTLVNETRLSGLYTEEFNGTNLASGVYFMTIHAGGFRDTKRMMLIK